MSLHKKIWLENNNTLINADWTLGIPPKQSQKIIDEFDQSPHSGLYIHDDKATLTIGNAKLSLSIDEAKDIAFMFLLSKKHADKSE